MEPLTIENELELDDYVEAYTAKDRAGLRSLRVFAVLFGAIAALSAVLRWPTPIGVWALMVPGSLLAWVLIGRQTRWLARQDYDNASDAIRNARVILDGEQIRVEGEGLTSYRAWSHVNGWLETPRLFVLTAGGTVTDILQKEGIESDDELVRLRRFLDDTLVLSQPGKAAGPGSRAVVKRRALRLRVALIAVLIGLFGATLYLLGKS